MTIAKLPTYAKYYNFLVCKNTTNGLEFAYATDNYKFACKLAHVRHWEVVHTKELATE